MKNVVKLSLLQVVYIKANHNKKSKGIANYGNPL